MDTSYWRVQTNSKPLFPDMEWNRPERRDLAGRLAIIGGNKLGFAGVAAAYQTVLDSGVGAVRVILPDALKKTIPSTIGSAIFCPSTPSGSLSRSGLAEMLAAASWSGQVLLAGDAGRNSETAIVYEDFISKYTGPLTITRDSIDLVKNSPSLLVERPQTLMVASFAQVQKLFQAVYYPRVLTFSMQLMQLIDALHKFSLTYPCTIVTLHREKIIVAHNGQVVSQDFDSPMRIWRGETAARIASYWLWSPNLPLEAATASLHQTVKVEP